MSKKRKLTRTQKLWAILSILGHYAAGVLSMFGGYYLHPVILIGGPAFFFFYQGYENFEVDDEGWREMREFLIGYFGMAAVLLLLMLL